MPVAPITLGVILPLRLEWEEFERVFPKGAKCPECEDSGSIYEMDSGVPGVRLVALCMDTMGPSAANTKTSQLLRLLQPSVVTLLGIAGALDAECHLGDVVVAQEICAYQELSRVEDGKEGGTFRFKYSGSHRALAARLRNALSEFAIHGASLHVSWKEACARAPPTWKRSCAPTSASR